MGRGPYFGRVQAAKDALQKRAESLVGLHFQVIKKALKSGNLEVAAAEIRFLETHIAEHGADGKEVRMLATDLDAVKQQQMVSGPTMNFGINFPHPQPTALPVVKVPEQLAPAQKFLEAETVDLEVVKESVTPSEPAPLPEPLLVKVPGGTPVKVTRTRKPRESKQP